MTKEKITFAEEVPTECTLTDMVDRGLIVPATSTRTTGEHVDDLTNATAGDVVSYKPLAALLRDNLITQDDARVMLWLEANRRSGEPRESHVNRLLVVAFAETKSEIRDFIFQ